MPTDGAPRPPSNAMLAQLAVLERRFDKRPFTLAEAESAGLNDQRLRRLAERGLLTIPLRGVYHLGPPSNDQADRVRIAAAVLPPGGAIVRRTAAWIYGLDARGPSEQDAPIGVECAVNRGITPIRQPNIDCYQADLDPGDLADVSGVPCTTPTRTAVDLLRWLSPMMALACADSMAAKRLIKPDQVSAMLGRWPGERFVKQARRLAGFIEPRTESFAESWLRLRILDAGFPRPEAQIRILDDGGREVYRLDLGWPDRKIGIEYDGLEFHTDRAALLADQRRREDLRQRFGWHVIGVGRGEVLGQGLDLEKGIGELLGMEPKIRRRLW